MGNGGVPSGLRNQPWMRWPTGFSNHIGSHGRPASGAAGDAHDLDATTGRHAMSGGDEPLS